MVDVWAIDASAGAPSISAQEARLLTVVPFMAGAGASLGVRSGVRLSGSGTDLLVQAQGSPNMSVLVNTGAVIVQGAISSTQGAYTWVNDTALTRTIAAAHATLARTDLVVVRIRDANVDTSGGRDGDVIVITGTAGAGVPSLPTDATYMTIAQISVPAAVTTITTARITDKRQYTAALGAPIPCLSTARPAGLPNQRIVETDTGFEYRWNGTKYLRDPVRLKATLTSWSSSTTPSAVTGLSMAVEANSVYEVDMLIVVFGLQNVGVSLSLQMPAGATADGLAQGWLDTSGAFSTALVSASTTPVAMSRWGFTGATNRSPVTVRFTITTAGTAGAVTLLGAQGTSNASASTVNDASWMELRQVA